MTTSFQPISLIIKDINRCISKKNSTHLKYHRLVMRCIPLSWRHRILVGPITNQRCQLCVETTTEAFQLHFLLPEIQTRLAQKLRTPPQLKVNAYPNLWANFPKYHQPIKVRKAHTYSTEEAHAVIQNFLSIAS